MDSSSAAAGMFPSPDLLLIDMGQVIAIDADSLTTQTTLDQLLFAQQVSQEAAAQAVQAAESAPITAAS